MITSKNRQESKEEKKIRHIYKTRKSRAKKLYSNERIVSRIYNEAQQQALKLGQ